MFNNIGKLLKKGVTAMTAFASIMFAFVSELGFLTQNKVLTVMVAFMLVGGGLTTHLVLDVAYFYGYIALVFAGGLALKGYNSARSTEELKEIGTKSC